MRTHLADCSAFWAELGVSVEEQQQAAPWAFAEPPAPSEPGRRVLFEDRPHAWNEISGPADLNRRRPQSSFDQLLAALAEHALIPD